MSLSLNHNLIFPLPKLLNKKRIVVKLVSPFPITATLPEHEYQSPYAEEPLVDVPSVSADKPCEPLVEELRVYSKHQKTKTTSSQTCQASNPNSGNPISTPSLKSSPPAINNIDHPNGQRKKGQILNSTPYI